VGAGDPAVSGGHPSSSLAAAVIAQAFRDLRGTGAGIDRKKHSVTGLLSEARRFLTEAAGPWAQSREAWADAAGVLPDIVRARALHFLRADNRNDVLAALGRQPHRTTNPRKGSPT
jgi:hypothetical protein